MQEDFLTKKTFDSIQRHIYQEKKIIREIVNLQNAVFSSQDERESQMLKKQIKELGNGLFEGGDEFKQEIERLNLPQSLPAQKKFSKEDVLDIKISTSSAKKLNKLEELSFKWANKKEKKRAQVQKSKPNFYVKYSNAIFSNISNNLLKKKYFKSVAKDLIKANMPSLPTSYVSSLLMTTLLSFVFGIVIMIFFMYFNFQPIWPMIISATGNIFLRLQKVVLIPVVLPLVTFVFMYFYPALEKKSLEIKINQELPFATIHMASISGSLLEPSKIFQIILSADDYPNLEKQFNKILNEVHVYGYDLVSALRSVAFNSPSDKFSDLLNGLATTISSGGDLQDFFGERAESLLFDHRLEREKQNKTAETFMDIYISVVIAAPMILMLLLMMIKISGLGLSLGIGTLTLIMVMAVSLINIVFLVFLHLKQPAGG